MERKVNSIEKLQIRKFKSFNMHKIIDNTFEHFYRKKKSKPFITFPSLKNKPLYTGYPLGFLELQHLPLKVKKKKKSKLMFKQESNK